MGAQRSAYTVWARGVNLNAVGDTPVHVPFGKYIVRRVTVTNASRTLAVSAATVGAYTAAAAGGTAIVTPAVATTLTTPTKFNDRTVAATTDYLTAQDIYVRVGVADGVATTADVYFELQSLE